MAADAAHGGAPSLARKARSARASGRKRRARPGGTECRRAAAIRRSALGGEGEEAIRAALRRRGLKWAGERDPTPVLLPSSRAAQDRFYALCRRYSFRLLVRDLLKHRLDCRPADLVRYCTPVVALRYLRALVGAGLVVRCGRGHYRVRDAAVRSFGPTLEWLVARVLAEEFGCQVAWGLRIEGVAGGGDYDVLALAEGQLIQVEVKSAPPRQIFASEVSAFLDRVEVLAPQAAIFLCDTQLRMRDKVVELFRAEMGRRGLRSKPVRCQHETWRVGKEIFITNSDPDMAANLGVCLAAFFRSRALVLA